MIDRYRLVRKIKKIYKSLLKYLKGKNENADELIQKILELEEYDLEGIMIGPKYCSIESLLEAIDETRDVDIFARADLFFKLLDI